MRFQNYLQEKLKISQYRDIVKQWKQSGISKRFDDVFDDKDRIYEPYKGEKPKDKKYNEIRDRLENHVYSLYDIKDYNKGILVNKETKKEVKVVKVLNGFINNIMKNNFDNLRTKF